MVPSSTSLQSTASASAAADGGPLESQSSVASSTLFQKHPQEPNLYMIPPGLHATYQPVPVLLRFFVWVAAVISSTALSFRPILTIVHKDAWSVRTTIGLIVKVSDHYWTKRSVIYADSNLINHILKIFRPFCSRPCPKFFFRKFWFLLLGYPSMIWCKTTYFHPPCPSSTNWK